MDELWLPVGRCRVETHAVIKFKKEQSGTDAAEQGKSPLFLPEGHPLFTSAECIGQTAFFAIDPAVNCHCELIWRRRRRRRSAFSVKKAHRVRLMIVS